MDVNPTEKKPTWWLLYALGTALVTAIAGIDTSVPSGAARVILELAAVVTASVLMLGWVLVNRGRIELAETRTHGQMLDRVVAVTRVPRRKNPIKIVTARRHAG